MVSNLSGAAALVGHPVSPLLLLSPWQHPFHGHACPFSPLCFSRVMDSCHIWTPQCKFQNLQVPCSTVTEVKKKNTIMFMHVSPVFAVCLFLSGPSYLIPPAPAFLPKFLALSPSLTSHWLLSWLHSGSVSSPQQRLPSPRRADLPDFCEDFDPVDRLFLLETLPRCPSLRCPLSSSSCVFSLPWHLRFLTRPSKVAPQVAAKVIL